MSSRHRSWRKAIPSGKALVTQAVILHLPWFPSVPVLGDDILDLRGPLKVLVKELALNSNFFDVHVLVSKTKNTSVPQTSSYSQVFRL